jgi:hypothetical protein
MSQKDLSGKPTYPNQRLLAEDSHANPIRVQENVKRLVMSVTCGQNCGELFAKLTPAGFWVKTSRGSVQVRMDGSLVEYCETWPRWGMLLGGVAGKLQMSVHPTIGKGSSLLPTVMANNLECEGSEYCGIRHSLKLHRALNMIPTLTKADAHGHGYQKQKNGTKTLTIARLLPTVTTPRPHDSEKTAGMYIQSQNQVDLTVILGKNHGLKLQPAFAEWMMGFSQGWTDFDALEMPLFLNKRIRRSKRSPILKMDVSN